MKNRYRKRGAIIQTEEYGAVQLGLPFGSDMYYEGGDWAHVVQMREVSRPDLIAFPFFSDPYEWEQILDYNGVIDPIGQVRAGMTLVVPVDKIQDKDIELFTYRGVDTP